MALTVTVKLDDGTGTFPYDVSTFVRMVDGITVTRGRADELSQIQPGQLTLTFDNVSGKFTFGSSTYGIKVDQKIRVSLTAGGVTKNQFTGYVQAWPTAWPGGQKFSTVTITATDQLARFARYPLRSVLEEEILADGPWIYYTFGEPAGATYSVDSSGHQQPNLAGSPGSAGAYNYGTATGPGTDSLTALSSHARHSNYITGGTFSYVPSVPQPPGATWEMYVSGVTAAALFGSTSALLQFADDSTTTGYTFGWSNNTLTFTSNDSITTSVTPLTDGNVHQIIGTWTRSTAKLVLYVDGVQVASGTAASNFHTMNPNTALALGTANNANINVAHYAAYPVAISAARVAAHWAAATTGYAGETPAARVSRVVGYESTATSVTLDPATSATAMPFKDFTGSQASDVIQTAMDAEQGVAFVDGSGVVQVHNRTWLPKRTTPDLTVDTSSDIVDTGTTVQVDAQAVLNWVTARRDDPNNAAITQVVANLTSVGTHGQYPGDYTYQVATDDEALYRAQWIVGNHAEPQPRVGALTLDLLTADASVQAAALALEIDSRLKVTGLPTQTPGGTTGDFAIAGLSHTVTDSSWTLTVNVVSWSLSQAWVLGDPVYGVLGSTTRLGV